MKEKQTTIYSPPLGESFIATCHNNGVVRQQEREKIRSVQVLNDMLQLGYIRKVCRTPIRHELNGEIGAEMEKLVAHITNLRRSKTTINDYRLYLSEFLAYLTDNEVRHVNDITENHLICFIMSHPTNKTNIVSALRVLFRYATPHF
jgi:hypothetical protein